MSKPQETEPEDCPQPGNHDMFMYCPSCTWVYQAPPAPEKYVVLKVDDWNRLCSHPKVSDKWLNEMILDDVAVLRLRDITVAPILHTYASMITSFRELLENNGTLTEERGKELQDIADWAHESAVRSEAMNFRRLPD